MDAEQMTDAVTGAVVIVKSQIRKRPPCKLVKLSAGGSGRKCCHSKLDVAAEHGSVMLFHFFR